MERFFAWRKRVNAAGLKTDYLFPMPSALSGVARILDIGCTYTSYNRSATPEYNRSATPEDVDAKAIYSDWAAVGQDLIRATRNFDGK